MAVIALGTVRSPRLKIRICQNYDRDETSDASEGREGGVSCAILILIPNS